MDVITALVLLIVVLVYLSRPNPDRKRTLNMLSKFPRPPWYPIVGCVGPFIFQPRNLHLQLTYERLKKYNGCYLSWIGQVPVVNTALPQHAEVILNNTKHLDKSFMYKFVHPWLGTGLLTSTGQKWHSHRKMITPTFHFTILSSFVEVFSEKKIGNQGFDVYPYITKCALDIICETAMGTTIEAQEKPDSSYVRAIYDMGQLVMQRIVRPWLHPDFLYHLTPQSVRYRECLKLLHNFTDQVIRERRAQHSNSSIQLEEDNLGRKHRVAFLDMLLEASDNGTKLTDHEIREEVDTFMFEGHDTTSAGMGWAIYLLGLHPDIQDKVHEELDNIFQGSDRAPSMKDLNEMKYLERVIKEALRLYPSVPGYGRIVSEDLELGEYTVPAGTTVNIHVYALHLNSQHFPNPEKFDPDRFLPERVLNRHPYAYIPFSAGPRNCIGQKFALLEEKTLLSYILRNYKIKSLEKRGNIRLIGEMILRTQLR
ncbi:hypothetical protein L9F63_006140, partial [Diploptera punctata]